MKKLIRVFFVVLILCSIFVMPATVSAAKNGLRTEGGVKYYYVNGRKVKNKLGIKIGSYYYRINSKGVVKKVAKVDGLAGIYAEKQGRSFKKCFMAISKMPYVSKSFSSNSSRAVYGFLNKKGDCKVQVACLYYVAKALGMKGMTCVNGYVPQAKDEDGNPTKFGKHSWMTMTVDGELFVYDPSLGSFYYNKKDTASMALAYKFQYGASGTYQYYDSNKQLIRIETEEEEIPEI